MFVKIKKLNGINIIAFIIVVSLSFLLFSESLFAEETETIDGKRVYRGIVELEKNITDLTELEEDSDLIIKGIIQEEKENLMVSDSFGYTNTKVFVTNVLKGNKNLLNQIIIYREPYFEKVINNISEYFISENYEPAIVNNEYILFLKEYTGSFELYKGVYSLRYYEKGKYLVNDNLQRMRTSTKDYVDGLSNEELNIGPDSSKVYRDIYKSVIDKYILKNDVSDVENEKPQENINVAENKEEVVEETVKSVSLGVNKAINKNGNVLIPVSAAAELLDCKIEWNAYTKTAAVKKDDVTAEFPINQSFYILNGIQHGTNVKAEIYNSKTYVPINIINDVFGTEIVYNSAENEITLQNKSEID